MKYVLISKEKYIIYKRKYTQMKNYNSINSWHKMSTAYAYMYFKIKIRGLNK